MLIIILGVKLVYQTFGSVTIIDYDVNGSNGGD